MENDRERLKAGLYTACCLNCSISIFMFFHSLAMFLFSSMTFPMTVSGYALRIKDDQRNNWIHLMKSIINGNLEILRLLWRVSKWKSAVVLSTVKW